MTRGLPEHHLKHHGETRLFSTVMMRSLFDNPGGSTIPNLALVKGLNGGNILFHCFERLAEGSRLGLCPLVASFMAMLRLCGPLKLPCRKHPICWVQAVRYWLRDAAFHACLRPSCIAGLFLFLVRRGAGDSRGQEPAPLVD